MFFRNINISMSFAYWSEIWHYAVNSVIVINIYMFSMISVFFRTLHYIGCDMSSFMYCSQTNTT